MRSRKMQVTNPVNLPCCRWRFGAPGRSALSMVVDLLRSYQAIGRIEGAIAHHAEEVFTSLTDEEKQRAEGLFLRLVRPGEAGGVTRRTAKLDEFDPQTQSLAKKLGGEQYRLLNLGEDTVEITHEALATQWQLYQQWISNSPADPRGDDLR